MIKFDYLISVFCSYSSDLEYSTRKSSIDQSNLKNKISPCEDRTQTC